MIPTVRLLDPYNEAAIYQNASAFDPKKHRLFPEPLEPEVALG